jgi:hypothetical protein
MDPASLLCVSQTMIPSPPSDSLPVARGTSEGRVLGDPPSDA